MTDHTKDESSFITNDSIIEIVFFPGDVQQFPIGNSNNSNTKYMYFMIHQFLIIRTPKSVITF